MKNKKQLSIFFAKTAIVFWFDSIYNKSDKKNNKSTLRIIYMKKTKLNDNQQNGGSNLSRDKVKRTNKNSILNFIRLPRRAQLCLQRKGLGIRHKAAIANYQSNAFCL